VRSCMREAAEILDISVAGFDKAKLINHVQANIKAIKPVMLGIKAKDVKPEPVPDEYSRKKWMFPILPVWNGDVELVVHAEETYLQISPRTGNTILQDLFEGIGQHIGFGYGRRRHGTYGRFLVRDFAISRWP
jgi:hypothetical protein